jgi:hypothetical protein
LRDQLALSQDFGDSVDLNAKQSGKVGVARDQLFTGCSLVDSLEHSVTSANVRLTVGCMSCAGIVAHIYLANSRIQSTSNRSIPKYQSNINAIIAPVIHATMKIPCRYVNFVTAFFLPLPGE